jgi:hypothetical protein
MGKKLHGSAQDQHPAHPRRYLCSPTSSLLSLISQYVNTPPLGTA